MGWVFPEQSSYEEWKKVLSHDCRVGEDQYRVEILPITFFEHPMTFQKESPRE
jgi:hypothetical protein